MKAVLAGAALASLICSLSGGAVAEEKFGTGAYFRDACKSSLDDKDNREIFRQGQCVGMLQSLSFFSDQLSSQFKFCSPASVKGDELAKILIAYLDSHASEMQASMLLSADKAFRAQWPCK